MISSSLVWGIASVGFGGKSFSARTLYGISFTLPPNRVCVETQGFFGAVEIFGIMAHKTITAQGFSRGKSIPNTTRAPVKQQTELWLCRLAPRQVERRVPVEKVERPQLEAVP